jgi:hypothetical protein
MEGSSHRRCYDTRWYLSQSRYCLREHDLDDNGKTAALG